MSLIEKASKRLEELKRTGVEIVDGLATGTASRHSEGPAASLAGLRASARQELGRGPASVQGSVTSRKISIDLARLAAMGYVTPDAPRSPIATQFRVIKRPLIANAQGRSGFRPKNANLIMMTSALAGEGKSYCALNLAMSIAMELDSTVLLVDTDVANPSLLRMIELPQTRGLMDVLSDPTLDLANVILRTNVEKLSILPAGTPHQRATEFLASDAMTRLVDEMASRYPERIIIFDSPPLLLTTESPVLATYMGQIVVVVESERTTANTLKQALASIEQCPVVLTMLNKAHSAEIGTYYGYGYRSGS